MQKKSQGRTTLLWLALAVCGAAQGQTQQNEPQQTQVLHTLLPASALPAHGSALGHATGGRAARWQPLALAQLADKRAGSDTVSNNMDVAGSVSGNSAINVVTGANAISAASFANAAGLPVAIQNSGANVLIQNATIINVQMR